MAEKVCGHNSLNFSSSVAEERPKSSLIEASDAPVDEDSEDDLPRNSHFEFRAKPCWGSLDVASWPGAVPKTYLVGIALAYDMHYTAAVLLSVFPHEWSVSVALLTGKTSGMPPLTGFDPSSLAASETQSFSFPARSFQLITVAPNRRTSTLSPVGRVADTREFSWEMLTCG